jgi:uncharacterized protein (DUF1501 family)
MVNPMCDPLFTSRREFLTGSLRFLSAAATMPVFLGRSALAFAEPQGAAKGNGDASPILVVVQLSGGNDGLNLVIPYENDIYYRLRPRLAIEAKTVLPLKGGFGLHPAAEGLKSLYDEGLLTIVQSVGYPNPNRSHFVSMDIWHTADPEQRKHNGWLGRYVDACCAGADPPKPTEAIALMKDSPLALAGERFAPLTFEDVNDLTWKGGRRDPAAAEAFRRLNGSAAVAGDSGVQQFLQRAAVEALAGAEEIRTAAGRELQTRGGRRRDGGLLAQQLGLIARMIAADLPTRIYYASLGGFDTHAGQLGRQQQLLRQLGDSLASFVETLRGQNLLDRVLILAFSEFGRRVQENASGGTDHGEAGPMLLVGSRVKAGLLGDAPDLANLSRGDVPHKTDFRQVYAGVLRDWMKLPPKQIDSVLGSGYGRALRVVKA